MRFPFSDPNGFARPQAPHNDLSLVSPFCFVAIFYVSPVVRLIFPTWYLVMLTVIRGQLCPDTSIPEGGSPDKRM